MTSIIRYLVLLVFLGVSGTAFAQEIAGRVLDEKKEPMINATIQVFSGGIQKGGVVTDYDGNYLVKPLDPGYYDVLVLYAGYDSIMVTKLVVSPGARTTQNFSMQRHSKEMKTFTIIAYKKPLVDPDKPSAQILTKEEIAVIPTTQITDLVSTNSNVYQSKRGGDLNIGGSRSGTTQYIVDGVVVRGTTNIDMAQGSVDQIEVITSGVPAKYGDISGGVVNITSRGVSQKMTGSVRLQHSIDGYNNNLATFSVAGPLLKKTVMNKDGVKTKKPVLGFALSGDYYYDNDRYPDYYRPYVTNDAKLAELQKNPLTLVANSSGNPVFNYSSDYVTRSDFKQVKVKPHALLVEERLNGKLDYQFSDNIHIVGGGSFDYTQQDAYNRARNLFAPEATPVLNTFSGRAYLRFTQKFGHSGDTSGKQSIISNAYYSLQADYQRTSQSQHDPKFKESFFEYAYVGKFEEKRTDLYQTLTPDSLSGKKATVLSLSVPTQITFERSERNPNLANYTSQYYRVLNGFYPSFMSTIQANNALINGDEPGSTYGMFTSPGTTQTFFYNFVSNQYALQVDASFDLLAGKTKHAIEFGLYYQQRIEKQFVGEPNRGGTNSIWSLMRQLVSSVSNGNLKFDKAHPIFKVNGNSYNYVYVPNNNPINPQGASYYTDMNGNRVNIAPTNTDTIYYNNVNIRSTNFDNNLRKKLFGNAADWQTRDINIDAYDPSTYSLDMFSADELLNSGRSYVSYYGYTYTGKSQGNVNFNDYWTAKDANGNYTRPIGAFSPNYIAGYIQDRFTYKDVHFNVGVRVDRFSTNEKVLKDPYSLYAEKTVNESGAARTTYNPGGHPANMGGNYVVYVDDNSSATPTVIGYRNGSTWYDPTGKYVSDPSVLKQYTGGRDPQPYLVEGSRTPKITDSSFNPNTSFTDYTPQVTLQPRIAFSFPISDVADFYAHYDIYTQRPTSNSRADPSVYYFLQQNANQIVNNPNLKSQKTFDYEVGFQQKLNDHSALTITAFYKERKDMITVVPYLYAYPSTYYTYGNRDFSTTKGTSIKYDLRATNHLRMMVSYTLQFAEGTGSTPGSTNRNGGGQISPNGLLQSFVSAGLPNLRYVTALDYDSRHTIAANIDYRYGGGEGPMIAGRRVFERAGVDFIAKARSGEPYTRYTDAQGNTVIGGVAGSRKAWHYGVDMRIDKDFALRNMRKLGDAPAGVKPKRPLFLKAILQVNNLLNTRDVLDVYGYTGRPDDNGYLTSSYGQQFVPQQVNPQSYSDMYRISNNSPGNYNYARTMSIALEFNF